MNSLDPWAETGRLIEQEALDLADRGLDNVETHCKGFPEVHAAFHCLFGPGNITNIAQTANSYQSFFFPGKK